jgi:hypothetical protein
LDHLYKLFCKKFIIIQEKNDAWIVEKRPTEGTKGSLIHLAVGWPSRLWPPVEIKGWDLAQIKEQNIHCHACRSNFSISGDPSNAYLSIALATTIFGA